MMTSIPLPMPRTLQASASDPKPPRHLKSATKKWWREVVADYELQPHHLRLLQLAAESWDRGQAARQILDRQGLTFSDRYGSPRSRPEIAVERDARIAFARLIRELDLDLSSAPDAERPPPLRSNRRE